MKLLLSMLFIVAAEYAAAQNRLITDSAFGRPGDTVVLSVEIENASLFISFQFDMRLPSGTAFIGNSVKLSSRSTNHVVVGNLVDDSTVRILAYSPDNDAFTGNTGRVLSFKLAVANVRGEFPLKLYNAVIGDSLSLNILSGSQSGILSVFPVGIREQLNGQPLPALKISPNPVREGSAIEFSLKALSRVEITLHDNMGRQLLSEPSGEFGAGDHHLPLPGTLYASMTPGTLYFLGLHVQPWGMKPVAVYKKIVK